MKIIRNNTEIELTNYELREAAAEYDQVCREEDVETFADEHNIDMTDEQIKTAALQADRHLSNCDGYFESYWACIENAILSVCLAAPVPTR